MVEITAAEKVGRFLCLDDRLANLDRAMRASHRAEGLFVGWTSRTVAGMPRMLAGSGDTRGQFHARVAVELPTRM